MSGGFFSNPIAATEAFVNDPSSAVTTTNNNVVKPLVNDVTNVVTAAANDPIGTAAKVIAVASGNPELLPVISAADAAAHGADPTKIAEQAALGYVTGQAIGAVSPTVAAALPDGTSPVVSNIVTSAATNAATAAAQGKDPVKAAVNSAINGGVNYETGSLAADMAMQNYANQANQYLTNGASPSEIDVMNAMNSSGELGTYGIQQLPGGGGYVNTNNGETTYTLDDGSSMTVDANGEPVSSTPAPSDTTDASNSPSLSATQIQKLMAMGINPLVSQAEKGLFNSPTTPTAPTSGGMAAPLSGGANAPTAPTSPTTQAGYLPTEVKPTTINGPTQTGSTMNPEQLQQLLPSLTSNPQLAEMLKNTVPSYYTYSGASEGSSQPQQAPASSNIANANLAPQTTYNPLTAAGLKPVQPNQVAYYRKGGLAHTEHIPQFKTGTTGHYVQGAGDGQSDDIPAMLADGEYVFDADTVAALGNGSNKAGAAALDQMRRAIREHKRSAPIGKIPPKAKSPLEYLSQAMKGK